MNEKYIQFINEYLTNGCNGAKAYKKVYPRCSVKNASAKAAKLLLKPDVIEYMNDCRDKLKSTAGVTLQEYIEELKKIAFADVRDFVEWSDSFVTVKDSQNIRFTNAIESISSGKDGIKLKLHAKLKALEMIKDCLHLSEKDQAKDVPKQLKIKFIKSDK